jgi:ketosteroid isomerase-like protein
MSHPNEDLVRKGYAAFSAGDMDTMRQVIAADAIWHASGRGPLSGDFKGIDEIIGNFGRSMELSGMTLKVEVHDIAGNDEHVFAAHTASARREGKSLNENQVIVFHVSGGRVTEAWQTSVDQYAADEFWT